jgi:hypothetical protein
MITKADMIYQAKKNKVTIEIKKLLPFLLPRIFEFLPVYEILNNNKLRGWIFLFFVGVFPLKQRIGGSTPSTPTKNY